MLFRNTLLSETIQIQSMANRAIIKLNQSLNNKQTDPKLKQIQRQILNQVTTTKQTLSFFMLTSIDKLSKQSHTHQSVHPSMQSSLHPSAKPNYNCYFHQSYHITNFCINPQCTLPLCQKCIPIHLKQHFQNQSHLGKSNIISISQAYHHAVTNLQIHVQNESVFIASIKGRFAQMKSQISTLINDIFISFQEILSSIENQVQIRFQKFHKIKKGSLKALIFYFSDPQILRQSINSSKNLPHAQLKLDKISQLIKKFSRFLQIDEKNVVRDSLNSVNNWNAELLKNQDLGRKSQSFLVWTNNDKNGHITGELHEGKKAQSQSQTNVLLYSSQNFGTLLKEQRGRLGGIRNKNLLFEINYQTQNCDSNQQRKPASSSLADINVTCLQLEQGLRRTSSQKQEKQNCQIQSKSPGLASNTQNKLEKVKSSKGDQRLQKIKKKYIADYSKQDKQKRALWPQEKRTKTLSHQAIDWPSMARLRSMADEPAFQKCFKQQQTRNQIRTNIQTRLQSRSLAFRSVKEHSERKSKPTQLITSQLPSHNFKDQILKQPPHLQEKQFTLNKSNPCIVAFQDHNISMSIKKQLIAGKTGQNYKQLETKRIFQEQNKKKLNQDGWSKQKQEKNYFAEKRKNKFQNIPVKMNLNGTQKSENQTSKETIYEETNRIKLKDPSTKSNSIRNSQIYIPNKSFQTNQIQVNQPIKSEAKRFNYLGEVYLEREAILN